MATVMSLGVLLFGILSLTRLPVREYPDVESPIVSVLTVYRGASPQTVETEITDVLEEQLSTIEGVKLITSSSQEQVSRITVEFNLKRDVEAAANDVRDRVSRVRGQLPTDADEPIVAKQDVNAQPIIWLSLNGQKFNLLELSDVASNILAERLQRCSWAPSGATRCASGSIRSAWRHTDSRWETSRARCAPATPRSRRAGWKAAAASSRCARAATCHAPRNSPTSSCRRRAIARCGSATWRT